MTSPTTALQDGAADADDVATRVRQVSQLAPKTFRAPDRLLQPERSVVQRGEKKSIIEAGRVALPTKR